MTKKIKQLELTIWLLSSTGVLLLQQTSQYVSYFWPLYTRKKKKISFWFFYTLVVISSLVFFCIFQVSNYEKELEEMKHMTRQEYVASLRRYTH